MGEAELTIFVGQFAAALFIAVIWLVVSKAIPRFRRRIGLVYSIACALALIASLVFPEGPTPTGLLASLLAIATLYMLGKRALRKQSMDADTIISYENHNMF